MERKLLQIGLALAGLVLVGLGLGLAQRSALT
jgi:hypothetical protein